MKYILIRVWREKAATLLLEDMYRNPGPLQFEGPGVDQPAISLSVEDQDYMGRIKKLQQYLEQVSRSFYCWAHSAIS